MTSSSSLPSVFLLAPHFHRGSQLHPAETTPLEIVSVATDEQIRRAVCASAGVAVHHPNKISDAGLGRETSVSVTARRGTKPGEAGTEGAASGCMTIVRTPGLGSSAVAEHTIGLMLSLARQIPAQDRILKGSLGAQLRPAPLGIQLSGRCLGIVGLGRVGREVARKCATAFDMRVLAYDPHVSEAEASRACARLIPELERLLALSDFVTLHTALSRETRRMLNERTLTAMRAGAILINTSHADLVDHRALLRALRIGSLRGAALDVFDADELASMGDLSDRDGLLLTGNVAGLTEETRREVAAGAARSVLEGICHHEDERSHFDDFILHPAAAARQSSDRRAHGA